MYPNIVGHNMLRVWPPCCDVLRDVVSRWPKFDNGQIRANNNQLIATRHNRVAKRVQHVVSNNVAIYCVDMLRSFGRGLTCELELQILHMFCSSVHSKIMFDQTNDKFQVIGSAPEKRMSVSLFKKINRWINYSKTFHQGAKNLFKPRTCTNYIVTLKYTIYSGEHVQIT